MTKKGMMEIKGAKNSPYDTIRIRPEVRRAIEDYLEVLNRDLRKVATKPEDPVFCSLNRLPAVGRRLAPSSINELVKAKAKEAGGPMTRVGPRTTSTEAGGALGSSAFV